MSSLKDLIAFIIANYPNPEELTRGRLEKLVYLSDEEWAWRHGEQLSPIKWIYNDHGPFTGNCDSPAKELENEGKIDINPDTTPFSDTKKRWYKWKAAEKPEVKKSITEEEADVLKKVIDGTFRLLWGRFNHYVYSTAPMLETEKHEPIDIIGAMKKRRKEIINRARKEIHEKFHEDFKALAK